MRFRSEVVAAARRRLARGDRRPRHRRPARRHGSSPAASSSSSAPTPRPGGCRSEIALDRRGFVLTGPDVNAAGAWPLERDPYLLETSVPGIFACGDVRSGPVKRVAAAVGEGSMAIAFVHQYLRETESTAESLPPDATSAAAANPAGSTESVPSA